jgi:hypothetical protein
MAPRVSIASLHVHIQWMDTEAGEADELLPATDLGATLER